MQFQIRRSMEFMLRRVKLEHLAESLLAPEVGDSCYFWLNRRIDFASVNDCVP